VTNFRPAEPALRLAVIGDPVAHSRSPDLHQGFLQQAGLAGTYEAIRVVAGDGARMIEDLRARGYTGLNVTTPLKEEAFARAEWRDAVAQASGSVNTLLLGERIEGYNTDGVGAIGALAAAGLEDVRGKRVFVLGAGPTARAASVALAQAGAEVFLWNRTRHRAESMVATLGAQHWTPDCDVDAVLATLAPDATFDDELKAAVARVPIVVDANYGERSTLGAAIGRPDVRDGLGMLTASARASFEFFRAPLRRA
jgi:shikimate dehydrogenase